MISAIRVAETGVATGQVITVDQFIAGSIIGNAVEGRAEWRCCSCVEEMRKEQVNMHEAGKRAVDSHCFGLTLRLGYYCSILWGTFYWRYNGFNVDFGVRFREYNFHSRHWCHEQSHRFEATRAPRGKVSDRSE